MRKIISVVVVLLLLISGPVFAEETQKNEMPGMAMDNSMGMPMAKMGMGMGMGMGKRCGFMMGKAQMVATDEGGVIVLAGNKLMKYDADLNLVKEVELKMPMGPMGGKQCPMMGKMMNQEASPAVAESQEKTVS